MLAPHALLGATLFHAEGSLPHDGCMLGQHDDATILREGAPALALKSVHSLAELNAKCGSYLKLWK